MEFLPVWVTTILRMGGLCLMKSTLTRHCRKLPASGRKLYTHERPWRSFSLSECFYSSFFRFSFSRFCLVALETRCIYYCDVGCCLNAGISCVWSRMDQRRRSPVWSQRSIWRVSMSPGLNHWVGFFAADCSSGSLHVYNDSTTREWRAAEQFRFAR